MHGLEVTWVPIPAIYADERSLFRPVRDSALVLAALIRPVERRGPSPFPETPSTLPTSTSDQKCTPRYTRDSATMLASAKSGALSRGCSIPTAVAAANAAAA